MPKLRKKKKGKKYFLNFFFSMRFFLRDEKEQNSLRKWLYVHLFMVCFWEKKCYNTRCATRSSSTKFLSSRHHAFLRGITFRPQSSYSVVFFAILSVLRCDAANQRIRWIAIGQKGTNWEENLRDRQCWTPVVFEDVQADDSLTVDVAVVDACAKCHFRWLEWVLRGKVNI